MAAPGMWRSDRRLYVNRARTRVVNESSPEAAYVLVGPGGEIPRALAEHYGLLEQADPEPEPVVEPPVEAPQGEPEPEAETLPAQKAQEPSLDKARKKAEDK